MIVFYFVGYIAACWALSAGALWLISRPRMHYGERRKSAVPPLPGVPLW